nr:hypothetical protein CFP56_77997 [Quercus suber]
MAFGGSHALGHNMGLGGSGYVLRRLRYADAYDVQAVDQSNCWRVPAQVSSCGGTPAEMLQMGWSFPMLQNHVLTGKVSAGCSYAICNRMAARCWLFKKH